MMNRNKYYKPSFFILLVIILLVVLTTGCVSQKKYESALQEIARLSVDSTFQEYEISDLQYRKENVIDKKDDEVEMERSKLDALNSFVERQYSEIRSNKKMINELSNANWVAEEMNENLVIKLQDDVVFQTGASEPSDSGQAILKDIATSILKLNKPIEVWVVGHTDNQPYTTDQKDNWDLSSERSLSVTRELIKNNIDPALITASARSTYDPEVSNETDSGKQLNRRTEIILVPKTSAYHDLIKLIEEKS